MNRILASILAAALTLSTGCRKAPVTSSEIISTAEQIVSTDGRGTHETDEIPDEQTQQTGFKVSGTKLLDANGNEFIMRGINHPHSWFTAQDDTALEAIAATAMCIRDRLSSVCSSDTAASSVCGTADAAPDSTPSASTALIMHLKKRFILIPRYKISLSAVISFFTCLLTELSGWNTLR